MLSRADQDSDITNRRSGGRKPNILLIQADQLRYDGLGCNGNPHAVTPNLDRLASTGTRFTRHIAACPVCMPSRASLFTGRYPSGHGLWHNGVPLSRQDHVRFDPVESGVAERAHERQIISHVPTLPDMLRSSGYETRAIGKLHLTPTGSDPAYGFEESRTRWSRGEMDDWHGPYYGFDHVDLSIGHGEGTIGHYRAWMRERFPDVAERLKADDHRRDVEFPELPQLYPSAIPVEAHHSTWIAELASSFIAERDADDDPFFLYLGFPDPHHPFTPPADLAAAFASRETLAPSFRAEALPQKPEVIRTLVEGSSQRLSARGLPPEAITRMRQYTDAMIHLVDRSVGTVLDALTKAGLNDDTIVIFTSDHGDFLGDHELILKDTICANALVHVPFILRATGENLPRETSVPMSNADVLPTICALAGVTIDESVQGQNVLPAVVGDCERSVLVYGYQHEPVQHNFTIYDRRYRYTVYPGSGDRELYNHHQDPFELENLAGRPEMVMEENRLHTSLLEMHLAADNPSGGRIARF